MNKMRLLLLCLWAFSLPVAAGSLPDDYPESFQSWGKLNRIDNVHGIIVINDSALRLAPQVKVYTRNTRFGTLDLLRKGMTIGVQARGSKVTIMEIWVLPADYRPKLRAMILK